MGSPTGRETVGADFRGPRRLTLQLSGFESAGGFVQVSPQDMQTEYCSFGGPGGGVGQLCEYLYQPGKTVTLTAGAHPDSEFLGWTGACTGTDPCTIVLNEHTTVGADFRGPRRLTLQLSGFESAGGFVQVSPQDMQTEYCSFAARGGGVVQLCEYLYQPGKTVTLTAGAHPDSEFLGWTGACTGTDP